MKVERRDGKTIITIDDDEIAERKAYPHKKSFWFRLHEHYGVEEQIALEDMRNCGEPWEELKNIEAIDFLVDGLTPEDARAKRYKWSPDGYKFHRYGS